jgi:hypothetical protein
MSKAPVAIVLLAIVGIFMITAPQALPAGEIAI